MATLFVTNETLVQALTEAALLANDSSLWASVSLNLNVGALGSTNWLDAIKAINERPLEPEAQRTYLRSFVETSNWPLNEDPDVMAFFGSLMSSVQKKESSRATRIAQKLVTKQFAEMLPKVVSTDDDSDDSVMESQSTLQGGAKFNRPFEFTQYIQRDALSM